MTTQALTTDEQFFYDHAGWSHDPLTESPDEGRVRCAQALAAAERWLKTQDDLEVWWEDDLDGWYSHQVGHRNQGDPLPETCESCVILRSSPDPDVEAYDTIASLSCIDDASLSYRRVVAAELALELMPV